MHYEVRKHDHNKFQIEETLDKHQLHFDNKQECCGTRYPGNCLRMEKLCREMPIVEFLNLLFYFHRKIEKIGDKVNFYLLDYVIPIIYYSDR